MSVVKPSRKKVSKACVHCAKSHLPCDSHRPCSRCVSRGITDCVDAPRKRKKYLLDVPDHQLSFLSNAASSEYTTLSHLVGQPGNYSSAEVNQHHLTTQLTYDILTKTTQIDSDTSVSLQELPVVEKANPYVPHGLRYSTPSQIYTQITVPFSYTPGFHSLIAYLKKRFPKPLLVKMAKHMAAYRPIFIKCTNTLKEEDLIFMEQCYQRTLLEYDKFITDIGTPTIIWRRTAQISYLNDEFVLLSGYSREELLKRKIVELLDDESVMDYFAMFEKVTYGDFSGTVQNTANLVCKSGIIVKCVCIWTLKRDVFGLPMMVVGNYLPIMA